MVHLTVDDVLDLIKYAPSPFAEKEMESKEFRDLRFSSGGDLGAKLGRWPLDPNS